MRSPPGARMGAGGLPGRAHPSWADSPPCTPSIWAAWVGVINSVDDGAVNAKWLSGVVLSPGSVSARRARFDSRGREDSYSGRFTEQSKYYSIALSNAE